MSELTRIFRALKTALHIRPEPQGTAHWYHYHHV